MDAKIALASQDSAYLVAEAGKLLVIIFWFAMNYIMLKIGGDETQQVNETWKSILRYSELVFLSATFYNLGSLWNLFSEVVSKKKKAAERNRR
jgi:hypothetical protein